MPEPFGSGYASQYDLLYSEKDYEAECDLLEEVFRRYGEGSTESLLDLGCGTGNHAIPLARRGYRVVGVDRSPAMLDLARSKAGTAEPNESSSFPRFVTGDIRATDLGQAFDAVLMMFAVLGYQTTNREIAATLGTVRRHLRPGGLFVFDVWYGPAVLSMRPGDRFRVVPTGEGQLIRSASSRLDVRHHLCEVNYQVWRLVQDRVLSTDTERHLMRYFFPMELEYWLEQSGFVLKALVAFPDLDREPDDTTWNVLGVARLESDRTAEDR